MTFDDWWKSDKETINCSEQESKDIFMAATNIERERCARVCDNLACDYTRKGAEVCAEAIRRGE